jgi:hypothetical protein
MPTTETRSAAVQSAEKSRANPKVDAATASYARQATGTLAAVRKLLTSLSAG